MKIKEFTGKTTKEAIDNGLAELGVTIADVHVDVLQEGAKGLFGLFGSKPACVRLTVMDDEREDDHGLSDLLGSFSLSDQKKKSAAKPAAPKPAPAKPAAPKAEAPKPAPKPASAEEQSGIWLDALSSVLQPVPIMNAGFVQIGRRMLPIQDGKIEGAKPERVLYFQAPDDSMRAMRIEKGDLVLVVPQALPVDGAIMLVEYGAHRCLRRIRLLGDSKILLQSGDRDLDAQAMHISEIKLVGRAVRIEITL